jgi:predicted enzyme related to lactoylglutathione lyase
MGIYLLFGVGGIESGGMFNKPAEMPGPPAWLHYVRVDNADAAAERVKANGGAVINGPMDVPGGDRIAQCIDPQGAMFAVHSKPSGAV